MKDFFIERINQFTPTDLLKLIVIASAIYMMLFYGKLHEMGEVKPNLSVSIFYWLPYEIISNFNIVNSIRYIFFFTSILWLSKIGILLSSTMSVISFIYVFSVKATFSYHIGHTTHLISLLIIYLLVVELLTVIGKQKAYPQFDVLQDGFVIIITSFFFLAGYSKLSSSGISWAIGSNLQNWVYQWGRDTVVKSWILDNRLLASAGQIIVLVVETICPIAIFFAKTRILVGICLSMILLGFVYVFGFHFWHYIPIVLVAFLPISKYFQSLADFLKVQLQEK